MFSILHIIIIASLAGCSDSGANTPTDGDSDLDADAPRDVDIDDTPPDDGDTPLVDGQPPSCVDETPPTRELTVVEHSIDTLHLAASDLGQLAIVYLQGDDHPRDLMLARFDRDFTLIGEPTLVASARPFADSPSLTFGHDSWYIAWREALNEAACPDEAVCHRELRVARVDTDGVVTDGPLPLAEGIEIVTRSVLIPDATGLWIVTLGRPETFLETLAIPIQQDGSLRSQVHSIFDEYSVRQSQPAAALQDDRIFIVVESSLGLIAGAITPDTEDLTLGPELVIENVSAAMPSLASNDGVLGIAYIDTNPTPPGNRLLLAELGSDLELLFSPAIISAIGVWPRSPSIVAVGQGWTIAWHDGREDTDSACVNLGFCREDIFFVPASIAGPSGDPLRLSIDPNDCNEQTLAWGGEAVFAAWLTFRDVRRTAFGTEIPCDGTSD